MFLTLNHICHNKKLLVNTKNMQQAQKISQQLNQQIFTGYYLNSSLILIFYLPHNNVQVEKSLSSNQFGEKPLKRNISNNSYSFSLLNVNFENITIGLYVLIIFFTLTKFQEYQKSITLSSIKCLNFKFLWSKVMHKNKFINQIVNNI